MKFNKMSEERNEKSRGAKGQLIRGMGRKRRGKKGGKERKEMCGKRTEEEG